MSARKTDGCLTICECVGSTPQGLTESTKQKKDTLTHTVNRNWTSVNWGRAMMQDGKNANTAQMKRSLSKWVAILYNEVIEPEHAIVHHVAQLTTRKCLANANLGEALAKFSQHLPRPPVDHRVPLTQHSLPDTPTRTPAQQTTILQQQGLPPQPLTPTETPTQRNTVQATGYAVCNSSRLIAMLYSENIEPAHAIVHHAAQLTSENFYTDANLGEMLAKFLQHLPHPPTNYEDALARHSLPDTPAQTLAQRTLYISPNVQSHSQAGICQRGYVLRHHTNGLTNETTLANPVSENDEMDTTLWTSLHDRHSASGRPLIDTETVQCPHY